MATFRILTEDGRAILTEDARNLVTEYGGTPDVPPARNPLSPPVLLGQRARIYGGMWRK